ncbi:hypothetical protein LOTGIDRAFT_157161 [Lottia gigantea]|uniref:HAT C-terminal dimerisation domain-containing protein n=1 Tax=Lottia gigantea TaxID=225164 RepID=V4CIM5_LOTGI|nr:hypothetical protein LOTGIDRAFT_157161 [Lottia gigantea]ESP02030.1 hypothetical protein LOTGIDRAFT_157161 [Lottia gigantea]
MLKSLLVQKLAILAVLHDPSEIKSADAKVLDVADRDWTIIQDIIIILKPLEVATTHGLSYSSWINQHSFGTCRQRLDRNEKTKIKADLSDNTLTTNILVKGSALDPRYKSLMFLNDAQKDMVWKNICEEAKELDKGSGDGATEYQPPTKKKSALEFLIGPTDIERYINEVSLEADFSPFEWWKISSKRYPTLARLARKYLRLPATSVPSERVFSDAGNTVTKKISNLDPGTVNHLIFLRDALK